MTAIAFIRRLGGTRSQSLCKERHRLWPEAISRNITILPFSVVIHTGQHRGGLPQQIQFAKVELQTDLIRVLEDLPQTASMAHTGCLCIQGESSNSQVHDLAVRPRAVAINTLDYYWDPVTWLFPPVPLIPLALEGVLE